MDVFPDISLSSPARSASCGHVRFDGSPSSGAERMKKWMCQQCGWTYDEQKGDPTGGIAPGTRWEDVPQDWICPDCGTPKSDFEMIEI